MESLNLDRPHDLALSHVIPAWALEELVADADESLTQFLKVNNELNRSTETLENIVETLDRSASKLDASTVSTETVNSSAQTLEDLRETIDGSVTPPSDISDDKSVEHVFEQAKKQLSSDQLGHLHPLTVFCLFQLVTAERSTRLILPGEIQSRHMQYKSEKRYNKKWTRKPYNRRADTLVELGLLEKVEGSSGAEYGLPAGKPLAPAFDSSHPENMLDEVHVDPPTERAEKGMRTIFPNLIPSNIPTALSTPAPSHRRWETGLAIFGLGAILSVWFAGSGLTGQFGIDLIPMVLLFGLISVGFATLIVDVLDQMRFGYNETSL